MESTEDTEDTEQKFFLSVPSVLSSFSVFDF
jgi:hypothetical protein